MGEILRELKAFFRRGDIPLLVLCLVTTAFGCVIVASATNYMNSSRYIIVQLGATVLGVLAYMVMSSIDVDTFSEHRRTMVLLNCVLILLLIPFGTDNGSGNKSWLHFPFLPVNIQPAEICKITLILIMASVMNSHQNRLSSFPSILHYGFHLVLIFGLNVVISRDLGVSLIFVAVFVGMAFGGGVHMGWFALAASGIGAMIPIIWNYFLEEYQKKRLQVLWDPTLDPNGIDERYQSMLGLRSLTGGGMTGQGLFNGTRTQTDGALPAQHTDFIFSAAGEELGYLGCLAILLLLGLIIARCIQVGLRSPEFIRRLVCFGAASALLFQILINVGMNLGVMPIIGITLPFISYGGSSIVTLYAMLGLVSGVHARPTASTKQRYIRPY